MQTKVLKPLAALLRDEAGQGLVEYALVLALVSVVAIAALTTLGGNLTGTLTRAANALK